jgi:hypothetical protein
MWGNEKKKKKGWQDSSVDYGFSLSSRDFAAAERSGQSHLRGAFATVRHLRRRNEKTFARHDIVVQKGLLIDVMCVFFFFLFFSAVFVLCLKAVL